jgi:hypothetical protein
MKESRPEQYETYAREYEEKYLLRLSNMEKAGIAE